MTAKPAFAKKGAASVDCARNSGYRSHNMPCDHHSRSPCLTNAVICFTKPAHATGCYPPIDVDKAVEWCQQKTGTELCRHGQDAHSGPGCPNP